MRTLIIAIALFASSCKGKKSNTAKGEGAKAIAAAPKVAVATVLAKDGDRPPLIFIVEGTGMETIRLAAAASWADLDANKWKVSKQVAPIRPLDMFSREEFGLGKAPIDGVKSWDEYSAGGIDLASLEDTTTRGGSAVQDDPPPPEEEDKPDDGADESGGTGTAMALEEGKMGKQDSDRAEGQYKMQKNQEDPQLARQQAIEQARAAGILGPSAASGGTGGGWGDLPYASPHKPPPTDDGTPSRVAEVAALVVPDGKLERLRAMIVIASTAKARQLVDVLRETNAAIAVSHDGKLRPLRLQFDSRDYSSSEGWVEVRLSAKAIAVEAVPDAAVELADIAQLASALDKARKQRGTDGDAPVDILIDADVDVQRMIDTVVALDTAGVKAIGFGSTPPEEEMKRRGHRIPTTTLGQPNAMGDLDKALIRKTVKGAKGKITACYDTALKTSPALEGTVQVQFFIKPDGTVGNAAATGVDPGVADCIAGVIKATVFPKPNGGGGVQVNYPFLLRP